MITNNLIHKDYNSMQKLLKNQYPHLFQTKDTSSPADTSTMLTEFLASTVDMLAYYIDTQTAEGFLETARQPENIFSLCRQIGYHPHGSIPATVKITFARTEDTDPESYIQIPSGTICETENKTSFITIADGYLLPNQNEISINSVQGTKISQESIWNDSQKDLIIKNHNVANGFVSLKIKNEKWTHVDSFFESLPNSKHFSVLFDASGYARILFGDNSSGLRPKNGEKIKIEYIRTLANKAIIERNTPTKVISDIFNLDKEPVILTVENLKLISRGYPSESPEQAKKNATAILKTSWTAVTNQDFVSLTQSIPEIEKAKVSHTKKYHTLTLIVAPKNYETLSDALRERIRSLLEARKYITCSLKIKEVEYFQVDISAKIFIWENESIPEIQARVKKAIQDFFDIKNRDFGESVNFSEIVATINNLPGISHVDIATPRKNLKIDPDQIAKLGKSNINASYVGSEK